MTDAARSTLTARETTSRPPCVYNAHTLERELLMCASCETALSDALPGVGTRTKDVIGGGALTLHARLIAR